jgi:hypothetical protein
VQHVKNVAKKSSKQEAVAARSRIRYAKSVLFVTKVNLWPMNANQIKIGSAKGVPSVLTAKLTWLSNAQRQQIQHVSHVKFVGMAFLSQQHAIGLPTLCARPAPAAFWARFRLLSAS